MKFKFSSDKINIQTGVLPVALDNVVLEIEDVSAKEVVEIISAVSVIAGKEVSEEDELLEHLIKSVPLMGLGKHLFSSSPKQQSQPDGIDGFFESLMKDIGNQPPPDFFQQFGKPKPGKD